MNYDLATDSRHKLYPFKNCFDNDIKYTEISVVSTCLLGRDIILRKKLRIASAITTILLSYLLELQCGCSDRSMFLTFEHRMFYL